MILKSVWANARAAPGKSSTRDADRESALCTVVLSCAHNSTLDCALRVSRGQRTRASLHPGKPAVTPIAVSQAAALCHPHARGHMRHETHTMRQKHAHLSRLNCIEHMRQQTKTRRAAASRASLAVLAKASGRSPPKGDRDACERAPTRADDATCQCGVVKAASYIRAARGPTAATAAGTRSRAPCAP